VTITRYAAVAKVPVARYRATPAAALARLLTADFTAATAGAVAALPAGLAFGRASAAGYTDGATFSVAGVGPNVARRGRLAAADVCGLHFEPGMTNGCGATGGDFTSGSVAWNNTLGGGSATCPYNPGSGTILGPDGATPATRVQTPSGGFGGPFLSGAGLTNYGATGNMFSVWLRAISGTAPYQIFNNATYGGQRKSYGTSGAPPYDWGGGTAALTTAWQRAYMSTVDAVAFLLVTEGRAHDPAGLPATALDHMAAFPQFESGRYATTYWPGTRAPERLWHTAVESLLSAGQLTLDLRLRPLGGPDDYVGGAYLWYRDASNNCSYASATRRLTVTIGGVAWSPPTALDWAAGDALEVCTVVGNGPSRAFFQVNDGGGIDLGAAPTSAGALAWTGTLDLLCAGTTGQFGGIVERIYAYA